MVLKNEEPRSVEGGGALLSPREHALATGNIRNGAPVVFGGLSNEIRSPEYRAASALHGWDAYTMHSAEPMKLTREAFDAAIDAAKTADKRGAYKPHEPALAPHLKGVS
jgi:hypothetical protein